jgi:hypothetical protein
MSCGLYRMTIKALPLGMNFCHSGRERALFIMPPAGRPRAHLSFGLRQYVILSTIKTKTLLTIYLYRRTMLRFLHPLLVVSAIL